LKVLESFVHPWVGELRAAFLAEAKEDRAKAVIFDVPLLFETGGAARVDVKAWTRPGFKSLIFWTRFSTLKFVWPLSLCRVRDKLAPWMAT